MLVVTTNEVAGFQVAETLGQVFGLVVRSRGLGGNLAAGLRSLVGGEIVEYTQMLEEARRHAIDRLVENAGLMGADAVIMMRFDSCEIGETMTEVVAYGTAVRLDRVGASAFSSAASAGASAASSSAYNAGAPGSTESGRPTFGHRSREP